MKTILVTGRIGSGKTEVCRMLRESGYPVYDSDSRTKALYKTVPGLLEKVESAAGVQFEFLAEIFRNPLKREAVEAVVYPEVLADFNAWRAQQDTPVVFMESAIALQKEQFRPLFDAVLLVQAPAHLRYGRNPKAESREASQEDVQNADWIIMNDSSLEHLQEKVNDFLKEI